ncbi:SAM-dependent DNA methyltransferase [Bacteroidetes/Chlorobi group bacterium ChocPot_Mid]|nr:MAG: SAM-dependent DNA methyltransferase [Bacteroidetes/Chlorobi group bacterium ChocPot_Mid]
MITGELKSKIDKLWEEFWTGGITNPLTVIEQITFLIFIRLTDINESREEKKARRLGLKYIGRYNDDQQHLRWSSFRNLKGSEMLPLIRDEVFKHFKQTINGEHPFLKDAQMMIQKESLLVSAIEKIDELPLTEGDTKGDLYEYLLSKLTTAGINGQFRTPRHIIKLMVEIIAPKPNERIGDPACGTAGFLMQTREYIREKYTSEEGKIKHDDGGITFSEDLLEKHRKHIQKDFLHGFDFDVSMLRIASMNLMLHGISDPNIYYQDTLSSIFKEHYPEQAEDYFDAILANPPFKGSLDFEDVSDDLIGKVKTRKTELLFIALMLRMLKLGGRCATIVPDGVLFGASKSHTALRQLLVDDNQLEAIIKLPSGVFKPYAGVSTAIVIFTKGGQTSKVWFYDVENDGLSLDDKRSPIDKNDLPDCLEKWNKRETEKFEDKTQKAFFVDKKDIIENKYDLSINRYKEIIHKEEEYEKPEIILGKIKLVEKEISTGIEELEGMLK